MNIYYRGITTRAIGGDGSKKRPHPNGSENVSRRVLRQIKAHRLAHQEHIVATIRYEIRKMQLVEDHYERERERAESSFRKLNDEVADKIRTKHARFHLMLDDKYDSILHNLDELEKSIRGNMLFRVWDEEDDAKMFLRMNDHLFFKSLYIRDAPGPYALSSDNTWFYVCVMSILTTFASGFVSLAYFSWSSTAGA